MRRPRWDGEKRSGTSLLLAILLLGVACSPVTTDRKVFATPPSAPSKSAPARALDVPRLTHVQARASATIVAFLDAYNSGQLERALGQMTADIRLSDCDYRSGNAVLLEGHEQVRAWLRERFADHDALVLAELQFGEPSEVGGSFGAALSYERRTSDTLRSLGFPDGIKPRLATKAILAGGGDRLVAFVNGAALAAGPHPVCRVGR